MAKLVKNCPTHNYPMILLFSDWACDVCDGRVKSQEPDVDWPWLGLPNPEDQHLVYNLRLAEGCWTQHEKTGVWKIVKSRCYSVPGGGVITGITPTTPEGRYFEKHKVKSYKITGLLPEDDYIYAIAFGPK